MAAFEICVGVCIGPFFLMIKFCVILVSYNEAGCCCYHECNSTLSAKLKNPKVAVSLKLNRYTHIANSMPTDHVEGSGNENTAQRD